MIKSVKFHHDQKITKNEKFHDLESINNITFIELLIDFRIVQILNVMSLLEWQNMCSFIFSAFQGNFSNFNFKNCFIGIFVLF